MKRFGDWIQCYSGVRFYPLDPRPEEVHIADIAHALSNQCRFTGHTREFYSVAEHSCRVSQQCSEANRPWGLMHDAAEAYLVDLARPIKHGPGFEAYREAEARILAVISEKYGLPPQIPASVKEIDYRMTITEADQLLGSRLEHWGDDVEPFDIKIGPWGPNTARRNFMSHFRGHFGNAN